MKILKMITLTFILSVGAMAAADSAKKEVCFRFERQVGYILMTSGSVFINWRYPEKAAMYHESGRFPSNFQSNNEGMSGDYYVQGTGDGGNMRIKINATHVFMQGLWSNGTPIGRGSRYQIVQCTR